MVPVRLFRKVNSTGMTSEDSGVFDVMRRVMVSLPVATHSSESPGQSNRFLRSTAISSGEIELGVVFQVVGFPFKTPVNWIVGGSDADGMSPEPTILRTELGKITDGE